MTAQRVLDAFVLTVYTLGLLELLTVYIIKIDRLNYLSRIASIHRREFSRWRQAKRKYNHDYSVWSGVNQQGFRGTLEFLDRTNPQVATKVRELLAESAAEAAESHEIDRLNAMAEAEPGRGLPNPHYAESNRLEQEARDLATHAGAKPTPPPKWPKAPASGRIYGALTGVAIFIVVAALIAAIDRQIPTGGIEVFAPATVRWWHWPIAVLIAIATFLAVWIAMWTVWMLVWVIVSNTLALALGSMMLLVGWITARTTLRYVFHVLFFVSLTIDTIELGVKFFFPTEQPACCRVAEDPIGIAAAEAAALYPSPLCS